MRLIELTSISGMTPPIVVEVCNYFVENCVVLYQSPSVISLPPSLYFQLPITYETAPVYLLKITDNRGCVVTQVKYCVQNIVPPLYPYCDNCGSVEGFVSSPSIDGYYADDYSPYLYLYSSGTFGNFFEIDYTYNTTFNNFNSTGYNGKSFVGHTDNLSFAPTADTKIIVFESPGSTSTSFNLSNFSLGQQGVVSACTSMDYDPSTNKVFFFYFYVLPNNTNPSRRIGYFDFDTYSIEYNVANSMSGAYYFPNRILINPVTFEKYCGTNDGFINIIASGLGPSLPVKKVITGGTYSLFWTSGATIRDYKFNEETGETWIVTSRTGSTMDIIIVDPYTYSTTTVNQTCLSTNYQVLPGGTRNIITYYPGDGTPNSSKMFILYRNTTGTDHKIVQFDTSPPYNNSVFYNIPINGVSQGVVYSKVYNKLIHHAFTTMNAFDPTNSSLDYCPTLTLPVTPFLNGREDTQNGLIVYQNQGTNVYWLGLDETNAIECPEKIIDFYSGNQGPYNFNQTTLVWDSMCTTNVTYNNPVTNYFTIDAQISGYADIAYLSYSSTTVADWTPIPNINGDILINSSVWTGGTVFSDPDTSFILRLTFINPGGCELYGPVI